MGIQRAHITGRTIVTQQDYSIYKLAAAIFSIVILFVSTAFMFSANRCCKALINRMKLSSFVQTSATIDTCYLLQATSKTSGKGRKGTSMGFFPRFVLRYTVQDKEYRVDTKRTLLDGMGIEYTWDYIQKQAPGQKIIYEQYYSPHLRGSDLLFFEEVKTGSVKNNEISIRYNPKKPEEIDLILLTEVEWLSVLILSLFSFPLIIFFRMVLKQMESTGYLLPILLGIVLVSVFLATIMNRLIIRNESAERKPYFSFVIDERFNPSMIRQYLSPEDRDE